jgi:hypothetical protein
MKNGVLELKTKSDNVDPILHLNHQGRTVVSWSLNPPKMIQEEEVKTALLKDRIEAEEKRRSKEQFGNEKGVVGAEIVEEMEKYVMGAKLRKNPRNRLKSQIQIGTKGRTLTMPTVLHLNPEEIDTPEKRENT